MGVFYQEPDHQVYCGHALDVLGQMPDESVDMVITSPPYWGLRTYKTEPIIWGENHCEHEWGELLPRAGYRSNDSNPGALQSAATQNRNTKVSCFCLKCHAWKGELGLEPTIELYIAHLIQIFDEVKRVLKRTGTCWVNLDDSYAGSGCGTNDYRTEASRSINKTDIMFSKSPPQQRLKDIPAKSLCLIPQRFAIAMVNAGWILRNDIAWNKPNPMPESVKDRFTGSWEHLFFFAKNKRYFFEQQFEPLSPLTLADGRNETGRHTYTDSKWTAVDDKPSWYRAKTFVNSELGRNKRDVWEIATEPYPEAHFATFPEKLCETPILAGCPSMICKKCGRAREPIYKREPMKINRSSRAEESGIRILTSGTMVEPNKCELEGYTDCGCNADYEPGVVLDPFCGSGKALAVAKKLGRKSIGIDLNPGYCKLAARAVQAVPLAMPLLAT